MKITIEGEPKEIAAYELALKDGNREVINISQPSVLKEALESLINNAPVECPRKWN